LCAVFEGSYQKSVLDYNHDGMLLNRGGGRDGQDKMNKTDRTDTTNRTDEMDRTDTDVL
jgi:hypothetical protein